MRDIEAKQSLGQNWLVNERVADRIVAAALPERSDIVLEVGPGKGILTSRLARHVGQLIAVEKDRRLIEPLRERFANTPNVRIEEGDILELDVAALDLQARAYKVVANLPYYITARFLRLMLSRWPAPERAVLMVPKEVSQRLQATAGNMNLLALSVQAYADIEKVMDVARGSFRPTPDVDSTVLVFSPKNAGAEERERIERTLAIAKTAFEQKRKQLTATVPAAALTACSVKPALRPQDISWRQWLCIAEHIS